MKTVPITDIRNQTDTSPITLARLGIVPRYRDRDGIDQYDPVDVLQGIQRRFSPQIETQTLSHADAANHIGISEQQLTGLADQYGLRPNDTGAWNVQDVRQLYFVNNYPQDTSSEQDAANLFGVSPQALREFAKQTGYGAYTFINGKPHYTRLQVNGIRSKLQEIRDKETQQVWG